MIPTYCNACALHGVRTNIGQLAPSCPPPPSPPSVVQSSEHHIAIINRNHYRTDITTPSVSYIIAPTVSPRHYHTVPIRQIRPDIVRMQITITQTSRHPPYHAPSHHYCHTNITTPSLPHRHQRTIIDTKSLSHKRRCNFSVTQSCPARFYIVSSVFSLSRIVF